MASRVRRIQDGTTAVTLLDYNGERTGFCAYNDSDAVLYLKFGSGASATSYTVQVGTDQLYESHVDYKGPITGVWASDAGGAVLMTEIY